jgi:plasmid stabilization system protein ParE
MAVQHRTRPGRIARLALVRHVRVIVVAPYLVFCRYEEGNPQLIVLRVLHGRRNIAKRLLSEPQ